MALSGKLDEVGEADRWIWERLGHIWERLGCWTGSSQQPRRLIKTQILLAENLLEQGVGGALSNGIVGFIAVAAGMTGDATAADMTAALAYYNFMDDWQDDHRRASLAQAQKLEPQLPALRERWPRQMQTMTDALDKLNALESAGSHDLDALCNAFGALLGLSLIHI